MNIQKSYSSYSAQALNQSAPQKVGSASKPGSTGAQKIDSSFGSSDTVTISSSAIALAASDNQVVPRTPGQQKLLDSLSNNPSGAENIAYGMATIPSAVVYDISSGEIRLKSTGQLMDDDNVRHKYEENFLSQSSKVDAKVKEIYYSEKSKGTPAVDIIAKMIDLKNNQSPDYLEATGFRIY